MRCYNVRPISDPSDTSDSISDPTAIHHPAAEKVLPASVTEQSNQVAPTKLDKPISAEHRSQAWRAASCPVKEREALWTMSYTSVMRTTDQKAAEAEVNAIVRAARLKNEVQPGQSVADASMFCLCHSRCHSVVLTLAITVSYYHRRFSLSLDLDLGLGPWIWEAR